VLFDEPDSGLDPVRTALLTQTLVDINTQLDATIVTVTHNIDILRSMPDNIGMLFRGELVMFGPREVLLTSEDPVITQFVNGSKEGPIGMSEEKDEALAGTLVDKPTAAWDGNRPLAFVPQLEPSPGMPPRAAAQRRKDRVIRTLHTLPPRAQQAILDSLTPEERMMARRYGQPVGATAHVPAPTSPDGWGAAR
jgi:phospholipid/cholesterol/gamma-HCH transport system ATP-binding protein